MAPPGGCPASTQSGRLGTNGKGCAVTQQKQILRDRNSLRSHRNSLKCKAKPAGGKRKKTTQITDCILQTSDEVIPPSRANTHTHNSKSSAPDSIQALICITYKQDLSSRANRNHTKDVNVFADEEQQGLVPI